MVHDKIKIHPENNKDKSKDESESKWEDAWIDHGEIRRFFLGESGSSMQSKTTLLRVESGGMGVDIGKRRVECTGSSSSSSSQPSPLLSAASGLALASESVTVEMSLSVACLREEAVTLSLFALDARFTLRDAVFGVALLLPFPARGFPDS